MIGEGLSEIEFEHEQQGIEVSSSLILISKINHSRPQKFAMHEIHRDLTTIL